MSLYVQGFGMRVKGMDLMKTIQENSEVIRFEKQLGELVRIVAHLNNEVIQLKHELAMQQADEQPTRCAHRC